MKPALAAGPSGPVFRLFKWAILPAMVLAGLTALTRLTPLDFALEEAIFLAGAKSWEIGQVSLWWFLYRFGLIPAALVFFLAVAGLVLSFSRKRLRIWNRVYLFIILLGVTGPGLVSNLLLKEYWGRPRPREVTGLGGSNAFEPVLTLDLASSGKSFPCGHATMGYFFMGGFFLLRRYHRLWAHFFLLFGFVLGSLMGLARMCQGGHFFSDVFWAGAVIYWIALILFYALGLHRGLVQPASAREQPAWAKAAWVFLGLLTLAAILLGSPYQNVRNFSLVTPEGDSRGPSRIELVLKAGRIEAMPAKRFKISGEAWGHGVPTSRVGSNYYEFDRNGRIEVLYREELSGAFAEVSQNLRVDIPWDKTNVLQIDASDCQVHLAMPKELAAPKKIILAAGNGSVTLEAPGFGWSDAASRERFGDPMQPVGSGNPLVEVSGQFRGKIKVSSGEASGNQ